MGPDGLIWVESWLPFRGLFLVSLMCGFSVVSQDPNFEGDTKFEDILDLRHANSA